MYGLQMAMLILSLNLGMEFSETSGQNVFPSNKH